MHAKLSLLLVAVAMGGCASVAEPQAVVDAKAKQAFETQRDDTPITGSRLSRGQNDRIVKAAGNAAARSDINVQSLGNEVGTRSN